MATATRRRPRGSSGEERLSEGTSFEQQSCCSRPRLAAAQLCAKRAIATPTPPATTIRTPHKTPCEWAWGDDARRAARAKRCRRSVGRRPQFREPALLPAAPQRHAADMAPNRPAEVSYDDYAPCEIAAGEKGCACWMRATAFAGGPAFVALRPLLLGAPLPAWNFRAGRR